MSRSNGSGSGEWGRIWRYEGKRGVRWRIRYTDAAGKRMLETLGREPEWNRKRAEAELRRRLVDVEREGYRQTLAKHLLPCFGRYELRELEQRPELVDGYVT